MRKRAQRRSRPIDEPNHIIQKTKPIIEEKPAILKKNWWIAISLVGIFFLVLLFNAYFNIASGDPINAEGAGFDKYYLSGPDPYYNMRLVNQTLYGENAGEYPYYAENDPLLNYPLGRTGRRPPLLNMMAIGFSRFLTPFMDEIDAVGYSMQFVPALFGALLIFPVYFIGKELFNRKAAIIGATLIALIPIHISSGHGSAYSLFDHDSFNLLLFFLTFLFLIKSIKEKDHTKSILYALLGGVPLAALSMTWVGAQFLYAVIAVYAIVQMLIDIFTSKIEPAVFRSTSVTLLSGYLISFPVAVLGKLGEFNATLPLFLCLGVVGFGMLYYILGRKKIPWTLSLPGIFCIGGIGLIFLYFIGDLITSFKSLSPLTSLSSILFGSGIYGNKVDLTIAEANTYQISQTVMSFGPALYWLAWAGLVFLMYYYYKDKQRRDFLFIIVVFLIYMWLTGTAGRFLNDMVPLVAILGGWIIWIMVDKINYRQMLRNIRSAGGGFHGIRRGIKLLHIFGIVFIALLVIFPNAYLSFDAAIPAVNKNEMFVIELGENSTIDLPNGAYGLGFYKEKYWTDAYNWLASQDNDISNPVDRPAYISWWDYGFYETAIGAHPTVADNFQDGIPAASNFHTATSEQEAVAIWLVRLLEGNKYSNNGTLSDNVVNALQKHLGENNTNDIVTWIENPTLSPSYNTPIGEEYSEELSKQLLVGQQWPENAYYHDITGILLNDTFDDDDITWLYLDIQEATGYSIRYYGVEAYDKQIFTIFGFLADKSLYLAGARSGGAYNTEDDFKQLKFVTQSGKEITFAELENKTNDELREDPIVNTNEYYKDAYFKTMFYRTYIGVTEGTSGSLSEPNYQFPCYNMRHFCAEYISEYPKYYTSAGQSAVVIARYYAGAYVNGSITFMGEPINAQVFVQKNISHYGTEIPIDHDSDTTSNGEFSVIAPAGPVRLQIVKFKNTIYETILKNVTFNSTTDPALYPISDDDAMRRSDTYERLVNISIDPAYVEGYVYLNKDDDKDEYNVSIDEPLSNVDIALYEIKEGTYETELKAAITTDEDGYYNFSDVEPGLYIIVAELDGFIIHDTSSDPVKILPGNNLYNISKPEPAELEGTVYFDSNDNGKYDAGEEMSDVNANLYYEKSAMTATTDDEISIGTVQTDGTGIYSFSSLVPGTYIIRASKLNEYKFEEEVTLEENTTTLYNISMNYAPITVSGYTTLDSVNMENVSIIFTEDETVEDVENNTALPGTVTSDINGSYSIELIPGSYNVSVNQVVNESGQDVTYTFTGKLELSIGEGTRTYNIAVTKEEL